MGKSQGQAHVSLGSLHQLLVGEEMLKQYLTGIDKNPHNSQSCSFRRVTPDRNNDN